MNVYIRYNKYQTADDSYKLEKKCLTLLNQNYECTCRQGSIYHHFPNIINNYDFATTLVLSNNGTSIDKLNENVNVYNIDEQLDCIINNLKKNKINHLDMVPDGRNLCVNKNGVISLIDFEISEIDNTNLKNYYILKERIRMILNKCKYIYMNNYQKNKK